MCSSAWEFGVFVLAVAKGLWSLVFESTCCFSGICLFRFWSVIGPFICVWSLTLSTKTNRKIKDQTWKAWTQTATTNIRNNIEKMQPKNIFKTSLKAQKASCSLNLTVKRVMGNLVNYIWEGWLPQSDKQPSPWEAVLWVCLLVSRTSSEPTMWMMVLKRIHQNMHNLLLWVNVSRWHPTHESPLPAQ